MAEDSIGFAQWEQGGEDLSSSLAKAVLEPAIQQFEGWFEHPSACEINKITGIGGLAWGMAAR